MKRSPFEIRSTAWLRTARGLELAPQSEPSEIRADIAITRRFGELDSADVRLDCFTAALGSIAIASVFCLLSTRPDLPVHVASALPLLAATAFVVGVAVLAWVNRRAPSRRTICVYLVAWTRSPPHAHALLDALTRARADEPIAEVWLVGNARWPKETLAALAVTRCFEPRGSTFIERRVA